MHIVGIGENGGKLINDTTTTTPTDATTFCGILVLAEAVVDETLGNLVLDGETLPAGIFIEGRFTSIKLTSGSVIAYNSRN